MDDHAREGLCDSFVAQEALEKHQELVPHIDVPFATPPFSLSKHSLRLYLFALSMRQWLVAAPRVRAHRRFVESVPIADAAVANL